MTSPEILKTNPESEQKKVIPISRDALAKKLGIDESSLPDGKFFRIVDEQLDRLAGLDPKEKAEALKKELSRIQTAELADKAKELGEKGKELATGEALEYTNQAITKATETLKTEGLVHGKEAIAAVGAIATAGSVGDATKGFDSLSKVIDATSKTFSSAIDAVKNVFSSLFKMLGLDKLFRSIGGLFGMKFDEKEEKSGDKQNDLEGKKEKIEEGVQKGKETVQSFAESIKDPEKRKEFLQKMSKSLGKKISDTYFGGTELSENQLNKLYKILDSSFDAESLHKVANRLEKGQVNVGEMVNLSTDVLAAFPAKVLYELSLSGIIPFWAITQRVIVDPSKTLISLTLNGLGIGEANMSLGDWNILLHDKFKEGDTHALDVARVQLYGVNGILWRTLGTIFSGTAAGLIMFADTTSGVDGKDLAKMSLKNDFSGLAGELEQIEKTLSSGKMQNTEIFKQVINGLKEAQLNARIMQLAAEYGDDTQGFIKALSQNAELKHLRGYVNELKNVANDPNSFRTKLRSLLSQPSGNKTLSQDVARAGLKGIGGQSGIALSYLERIDALKRTQIELIGTGGLKSKIEQLKLAYNSLKMARSADTLVLHLEDAKDVSKFRAFLSVIPGGIKGFAEILPAASLVISLGSLAKDAANTPDATTKDKLIDVMTYSLFPLYGSGCFLMSKTIDINNMIQKGEMPAFEDIALTGAIGGIATYEAIRVAGGVRDIVQGNFIAGAKKLTYIHDIVHSGGTMVRGVRNIAALATRPAANPSTTKFLTGIASKMPHRGRLAIGAAAMLAAGGAYAYFSGPEKPEDIMKNLQKDGWIDASGRITEKLREQFYLKNTEQRKEILDELFILALGKNDSPPKTHYDAEGAKYIVVGDVKKYGSLIDSEFRKQLQYLGLDIDFGNEKESK